MRPNPLRVVASSAVTWLAATALAGCAVGPGGGCDPLASAGSASDSVQVSGAFGSKPQVSFPSPIHVSRTQVTTNIAGSGAPVSSAQQIVADVTIYDATTGQVATASTYTGDSTTPTFVVGTVGVPGLTKALVCARPGERLTAVIPPSQGIPSDRRPSGVSATDSLVAVVDVRRAYLARANGVPQVMAGGLPSVVLAANGQPGISLPEGDPPSTLQVADLRKGSGEVVRAGENVVVQYTGVVWKPGDGQNGVVFKSSWQDGPPVSIPIAATSITKGLATALAGQRIGSQVLAVVPASQGYGAQSSGLVPENATLVFVVDLLGKA